MSVRRLMAMAGGLLIAATAVPQGQLHAQLEAMRQDSRFIFDAASSNLFEIRAGQVAQSKATNPSVKQFGQQMVTDHTNLHNQLTAVVSKSGQFKPGMTDEAEDELERLEKLNGAEFDRGYMTAMVRHHQQDVATFQSMAQSARSTEARQIASNGLPVLQQHLNTAVQVANQIGVNTGVVATTPTTTPTTPTQNPPVTTGTPPVATQPGTVTTGGTAADIQADMPFIIEASSANNMEIRLGQIAQSKASNSAVKQFGQRMVTDHTNLQNQLTVAASAGGQTIPPGVVVSDQQQANRIERLSGEEFDRAYMSHMIRMHRNDVNEFQRQSQSASSSQVRTLTANSLPVLQQHLSLATQIGSQVGADTPDVADDDRPDRDRRDRDNQGNVRADAEFIRDVGADNAMQIALAELAKDRANNRAVRQYAEREKRDHEQLQDQWVALAERNDLNVSARGMGPRHREKITQLQNLRGRNFDRAYMTMMIRQHSDEVSYWRKEGRGSQSPQVRALVNRGLPNMEEHFEQARQIGRQVGVNPEAVLRNRTDLARDRNNRNENND
jgi:putative membrane protein